MGTVQVAFEGEQREVIPWCMLDRKWPEAALFGSMFCVCTTGSCAISALVGPFSPEMTKSRDRKRSCPALLFFRIFFPYLLSRTFFHVIFSLYFFPRIFFRTFFRVIFFPYFLYPYFFHVLFIPVLYFLFFSVLFFVFFPSFFISSSSTKCWLGVFSTTSASYSHRKLPPLLFSYNKCSLRRPRPITIVNYPLFIFIY